MFKRIIAIFFILLVIVVIILLSRNNATQTKLPASNKIHLTTSIYPIYFITQEITKGKAEITNLIPAGVEPHDFEPSAKEILEIQNSQLLLLNGGIEPWADDIKKTGNKNTVITEVGKSLMYQEIEEEGQIQLDPHVWLSPNLAITIANNVMMELIKVDPSNKIYYEENYKNLSARLDALDKKYQQGLRNCQKKDIVTAHNAFGYLAKTYGLNQVAISGISPESEPSAQDLTRVAEFAKKNNIHYIFFEKLVSPKLSQTVANEIGAQTLVLDPLEGISDDEIKQGKNYFTVMEQNLHNLQLALQCQQ